MIRAAFERKESSFEAGINVAVVVKKTLANSSFSTSLWRFPFTAAEAGGVLLTRLQTLLLPPFLSHRLERPRSRPNQNCRRTWSFPTEIKNKSCLQVSLCNDGRAKALWLLLLWLFFQSKALLSPLLHERRAAGRMIYVLLCTEFWQLQQFSKWKLAQFLQTVSALLLLCTVVKADDTCEHVLP